MMCGVLLLVAQTATNGCAKRKLSVLRPQILPIVVLQFNQNFRRHYFSSVTAMPEKDLVRAVEASSLERVQARSDLAAALANNPFINSPFTKQYQAHLLGLLSPKNWENGLLL